VVGGQRYVRLPARLPLSRGALRYVAPTGSDRNPGTIKRPWKTIQRALNSLRPGQTGVVRAGTYEENLVMRRAGTPNRPITIRNYPGERPVIRPAQSSPSYPLRITTGSAYLRVHGFVIERERTKNTVNVYITGDTPRQAHDIEISGCEVRNAEHSSGMFIDNANYHIQILGNRVHDNNESGRQHQGIYYEASNGVIANNVVYHHTQGFGIQLRTDAPVGPSNVIVANNTTVGNSLAGIVVEHTARNITIVNNISAFNGTAGILGYYSDGDHPDDPVGKGNVAFNNITYGNRSENIENNPVPRSNPSGGATIIEFKGGNRAVNPRFVDASTLNFNLGPGSPAIGHADKRFAPGVDSAGRRRDRRPDLGAYERRRR
jgi:hypothetical protein